MIANVCFMAACMLASCGGNRGSAAARPVTPMRTTTQPAVRLHAEPRGGSAGVDPNAAEAIITVLNRQADDWNRGDLDAFAKGYKNSPDILFMGPTIRRGYGQMLEGYRKSFPNREAMGKLAFSNLEVQPLDDQFATVTGRFHLERTAAGGGPASGYFLLVVEKTPSGWKIIRDATTDNPRPAH